MDVFGDKISIYGVIEYTDFKLGNNELSFSCSNTVK